MCNCITELKEPTNWKDKKGAVPLEVSIDQAISFKKDEAGISHVFAVTVSRVELTFAHRRTPVNVTTGHSFCPFCGTKYGIDDD